MPGQLPAAGSCPVTAISLLHASLTTSALCIIEMTCTSAGAGRRLLASSKPGPWRDWVVSGCLEPCPNLFLASWGFQCALGLTHCCQTSNTLCTKISSYKSAAEPKDWSGKNLTAVNAMPAPLAAPPSPSPPAPAYKACPGNGTWQNASATQFWSYPPVRWEGCVGCLRRPLRRQHDA